MRKRTNNYYSLTCKKLALFTVLAVVIQIIGLSLFILGFFPVKPTLSGMSGLESFYPPGFDSTDLVQNASALPPEKLKSLYRELSGVPPLFDRLILMVIDGLPAEFVIGKDGKPPPEVLKKAMPYTQSLLAKGLAIGYHAKAAPPTVTMPRLKAMVSGAVGGFLDVATNFNTQAFLDDNLIAQFLRIGWKMVMLGDETWLKLFPDMFARHDGVSSFFVKDTIQVDYNVSRHLTTELSSTDWDLLILHYLGLDHVGHIGGRNSNLMGPKLMEMDEVVKRIHSSIMQTQETKQRGTLLMVVSDHGMTEGGNHGGSSYEETDSLALFVSAQKFSDSESRRKEAYQVDMASTLALLFDVPIPKNNIGTVMVDVFTSLKDEQQLRILELNSWQLLRLLQTHLNELGCGRFSCKSGRGQNDGPERLCCSYLDATALHESWKSKRSLRSVHGDDYRSAVLAYLEFLGTTSKWLSSRSTDAAALYYVGMAGHFGLGNTNTLATVDVAGAFIGISSHSTIISGILMFIITYASPMLALLSMLMGVSANDVRTVSNSQDVDFGHLLKTTLGYPCLVPLGLNSILLLAYTIVLLGMRNHLFIWSVFSPKFLYVCATTVCVYVGVSIVALTATYTCIVFATRSTLKGSCRDRSTER
ncbi:UNVERIFIED_CONTAM: GPI ethanolamine phosphate transferase 2 [Sesamum latifolium]|uniref:GPI ethanolamine phosphate transferase 2 n=1 Tax=Sesamum latifolium TaxID=2727402 RepID=A0AAW2Y6W1_9LAMI